MHYLKDEKRKFQRFIGGLPLAFKDQIECDEPWPLEEVIGKLKHYHEQSKHKYKLKRYWKGNEKTKGKLTNNRGRLRDVGDKENVAPYKKFSAVDKGHKCHLEE